jgi:hypothetical protein
MEEVRVVALDVRTTTYRWWHMMKNWTKCAGWWRCTVMIFRLLWMTPVAKTQQECSE